MVPTARTIDGRRRAGIRVSRRASLDRRALYGAFGIALCMLSTGCFAARIPKWSDTQRLQLASPPLDLTVAVADRPLSAQGRMSPEAAQAYTQHADGRLQTIAASLRGAFRAVTVDSTATAAQLVVESRLKYCNSVIIPVWTILTLGIVPTVYRDSTCTALVFRRRGQPRSGDSVVVEAGTANREVLGLFAAPLLLIPRWTSDASAARRRHNDALHLAILAKREELERLAGRVGAPPP